MLKIKHFVAFCGLMALGSCVGVGWAISWKPAPTGPEWSPLPPGEWSEDAYEEFSEEVFLSWRGEDIGEAEVADADPTLVYRVKARQYLTDPSVSKVWVDLDRDWLWDLRVQFDGEHTHLWYSEKDNEMYGERLRWTGQGWEAAPVFQSED